MPFAVVDAVDWVDDVDMKMRGQENAVSRVVKTLYRGYRLARRRRGRRRYQFLEGAARVGRIKQSDVGLVFRFTLHASLFTAILSPANREHWSGDALAEDGTA